MNQPNLESLGKQKSVLSIYLLNLKFPRNRFNLAVSWIAFLSLFAFAYIYKETPEVLSATLRKTLEIGLNYSTATLGFLVAGFTIFSTVTKTEVFVAMARVEFRNSGESYLKYNLAQFMLVFVHYIVYLFVAICFAIVAQPNGIASAIIRGAIKSSGLVGANEFYYLWPLIIAFCAMGAWTIYLVLLLKSFVYNVFQVVTTTVQWELVRPRRRTSIRNKIRERPSAWRLRKGE